MAKCPKCGKEIFALKCSELTLHIGETVTSTWRDSPEVVMAHFCCPSCGEVLRVEQIELKD